MKTINSPIKFINIKVECHFSEFQNREVKGVSENKLESNNIQIIIYIIFGINIYISFWEEVLERGLIQIIFHKKNKNIIIPEIILKNITLENS